MRFTLQKYKEEIWSEIQLPQISSNWKNDSFKFPYKSASFRINYIKYVHETSHCTEFQAIFSSKLSKVLQLFNALEINILINLLFWLLLLLLIYQELHIINIVLN